MPTPCSSDQRLAVYATRRQGRCHLVFVILLLMIIYKVRRVLMGKGSERMVKGKLNKKEQNSAIILISINKIRRETNGMLNTLLKVTSHGFISYEPRQNNCKYVIAETEAVPNINNNNNNNNKKHQSL
ncbi:hypothetical protein PoB_003812300 [Plakobranchus ocellatus]|uniref:Uncharacterized protein n=1 Tax=Plakobranchus ocellatus TaxID=259542 RepID=A0AAV4AWB5_9GAST|nr:hypothetical protein PoB_003812300 [Plakobranchus ocellatus]